MAKLPPPAQKIHEFPWDPSWSGLRLRQLLERLLPALASRARLQVVGNGLATANGEKLTDIDAPIPEGASLRIDLRHGVHGEGKSSRAALIDQIRVLHDDKDCVVVFKASGVPVQPEEKLVAEAGKASARPLIELLKHYWKSKHVTVTNPILVQRLDKGTSGVLVLGKNVPASRILQRQAAGRTMERQYLAIVEGEMDRNAKGKWESWLGVGEGNLRQSVEKTGQKQSVEKAPTEKPGRGVKTKGDRDRVDVRGSRGAKMTRGFKGKETGESEPVSAEKAAIEKKTRDQPGHAVTWYMVKEVRNGLTLLDLRLETGKTHQIRIHCAEAGHPVVGDAVYTRLAAIKHPRGKFGRWDAPRLMLHAARLKFQHPSTAKWLTFREEMTPEMQDFWKNPALRKEVSAHPLKRQPK